MRAAMIPIAITRTQNISSKGRAILLINIRAEVTSSNWPYVHFNYLVSQTNAECCSAFDRPRRRERFHNPSTHRTREKTAVTCSVRSVHAQKRIPLELTMRPPTSPARIIGQRSKCSHDQV